MSASLPLPGPPQTRRREPGPGLGVSIGLMIIGVVVGIASIVAITVPVVRTFNSSAHIVPSQFPIHLRHARYTVFELTSRPPDALCGTCPSRRVTIEPSQVRVTAPDGEPVFVFQARNDDTMRHGSDEYTSAVQFDAPMSGVYELRVSSRGPTAVIVTRSLPDVIRSVLVWFFAGAVGGILLIAGLVMLIVGVTSRGRARRAAQFGWAQPAWGQPQWGQPWGQPQWGAPQYPPDDPWAPPPPHAKS